MDLALLATGSVQEFVGMLPEVLNLVGFPPEYAPVVTAVARLAHGDAEALGEVWGHDSMVPVLQQTLHLAQARSLSAFVPVLKPLVALMRDAGVLPPDMPVRLVLVSVSCCRCCDWHDCCQCRDVGGGVATGDVLLLLRV